MRRDFFKQIVVVAVIAAILCVTACSDGANSEIQTAENYIQDTDQSESPLEDNVSTEETADEDSTEDDTTEADFEKEKVGNELTDKHVRIRLDGNGKDIFALRGNGRVDYRYGPSIIQYKDGSMDAWFASPGDGRKEYDWITYKHSEDGGDTWGDERVVLAPTPGTADYKSVCDPDVFYYDGYYYMGYTGTVNKEGLCNNVFLARSRKPDGPYEKWDGNGWGEQTTIPIIYFYGVDIGWGVGEPSFVVVDDKLYVYSTLDSFSDIFGWVRATRVHTADLSDPMWPSKLQYEGICAFRNDCTDLTGYTYADSDSWDVAYLDDSQKFLAVTTNRRFKDDSCLLYYESYDGINFERISELNTNVLCGCHNCGISSDEYGHIEKSDKTYIGYAYSGKGNYIWGAWATRLVPVRIDYTDTIDRTEEGKENLKERIGIDNAFATKDPLMLMTDQLTYNASVGEYPVNINYYVMNGYRTIRGVNTEDINIEKYDHTMFRLTDDNRLIPVQEGVSVIRVGYEGLRRNISIRVLSQEYDEMQIKRFYPVCNRYDIKVNEPIVLKIRPMAIFGDYELQEMSEYDIKVHNIEFRSSDVSVCIVEEDGKIRPIAPGTAVITVQGENCRYTLDVYVSE